MLDELPYLLAADPTLAGVLQNWLDRPERRPTLAVCGSSQHMMHRAILDAAAPLYGRAAEAFAVRPLRPGYLAEAFPFDDYGALVSVYALWGGMPRYWELAEPFGGDLESAVDALVLDPAGPLHGEPDRLLREETPPATALRPVLDVIGNGAHRVSEIAGRLGKPASGLSRPLASLMEMGLVRRETPFGSDPRSGKRSLYRIDDPFLRLWFGWSPRIGRPLPPRLARRGCATGGGIGQASNPWPGRSCAGWPCPCCTARRRRWRGSARGSPRKDTGGATRRNWTSSRARPMAGGCWWARPSGRSSPAASGAVARGDVGNPARDDVGNPARDDVGNYLARTMDAEVCRALFVPPGTAPRAEAGVHVIDARAVMSVLR